MRRHKCIFKPCLIYIKKENLYDVVSYCCECGKIGAAINNDDRITNDDVDGRVRWRLKTPSEILSTFSDKYPTFIIGEENNE